MTSWKECKLGDFVESISETYKFKTNERVVFLNTSDIFLGHVINNKLEDSSTLPGQAKKRIKRGDFLFSEIRPANGRYALIDFDADKYVVSTKLMVLRCKDNIDQNYFRFFLTSQDQLDYLQMLAEDRSGTFPQITFEHISNLDILLPPLPEQKAIAGVLSSLDDKIDILRRQNKTLEGMAEALWQKMFIEDADECWVKGKLGDYIQVIDNRGKTPPFSEIETNFPVIEVNALTGNDRLLNYSVIKKYVTEDTYCKWFRAGHPKKYDTLIATVGSVGELAMFLNNKGSIAQNIVAFRAIKTSPFYLYQYLRYLEKDIKEFDIGSVQPSIKVTHLIKIDFIQPTKRVLDKFDEIMTDITDKLLINQSHINVLDKIRDSLLPKLMSGEIRVNY